MAWTPIDLMPLDSIEFQESEYAESLEWEFPRWLMMPCCFGVYVYKPCAYQVGNVLYIHPEILAALRESGRLVEYGNEERKHG